MENSTKIYIGRDLGQITRRQLERLCEVCGTIVSVVARNGFGFVEFGSRQDAENAIVQLNGALYHKTRLVVDWAHPARKSPDTAAHVAERRPSINHIDSSAVLPLQNAESVAEIDVVENAQDANGEIEQRPLSSPLRLHSSSSMHAPIRLRILPPESSASGELVNGSNSQREAAHHRVPSRAPAERRSNTIRGRVENSRSRSPARQGSGTRQVTSFPNGRVDFNRRDGRRCSRSRSPGRRGNFNRRDDRRRSRSRSSFYRGPTSRNTRRFPSRSPLRQEAHSGRQPMRQYSRSRSSLRRESDARRRVVGRSSRPLSVRRGSITPARRQRSSMQRRRSVADHRRGCGDSRRRAASSSSGTNSGSSSTSRSGSRSSSASKSSSASRSSSTHGDNTNPPPTHANALAEDSARKSTTPIMQPSGSVVGISTHASSSSTLAAQYTPQSAAVASPQLLLVPPSRPVFDVQLIRVSADRLRVADMTSCWPWPTQCIRASGGVHSACLSADSTDCGLVHHVLKALKTRLSGVRIVDNVLKLSRAKTRPAFNDYVGRMSTLPPGDVLHDFFGRQRWKEMAMYREDVFKLSDVKEGLRNFMLRCAVARAWLLDRDQALRRIELLPNARFADEPNFKLLERLTLKAMSLVVQESYCAKSAGYQLIGGGNCGADGCAFIGGINKYGPNGLDLGYYTLDPAIFLNDTPPLIHLFPDVTSFIVFADEVPLQKRDRLLAALQRYPVDLLWIENAEEEDAARVLNRIRGELGWDLRDKKKKQK